MTYEVNDQTKEAPVKADSGSVLSGVDVTAQAVNEAKSCRTPDDQRTKLPVPGLSIGDRGVPFPGDDGTNRQKVHEFFEKEPPAKENKPQKFDLGDRLENPPKGSIEPTWNTPADAAKELESGKISEQTLKSLKAVLKTLGPEGLQKYVEKINEQLKDKNLKLNASEIVQRNCFGTKETNGESYGVGANLVNTKKDEKVSDGKTWISGPEATKEAQKAKDERLELFGPQNNLPERLKDRPPLDDNMRRYEEWAKQQPKSELDQMLDYLRKRGPEQQQREELLKQLEQLKAPTPNQQNKQDGPLKDLPAEFPRGKQQNPSIQNLLKKLDPRIEEAPPVRY